MLPANFQIHLDYSLEQCFMVEFAASHRRKLIDITTKQMNYINVDGQYMYMYSYAYCKCMDMTTRSSRQRI